MDNVQSNICLRLLLFFYAVKSCVTYTVTQREKYHGGIETEQWRRCTLGFDEPPRRRGQLKPSEPPYGGGAGRPCRGHPSLQSAEYTCTAPGSTLNDMVAAHFCWEKGAHAKGAKWRIRYVYTMQAVYHLI